MNSRPKTPFLLLGFLFLMAASPAVAGETKATWNATCHIVFSGTSTLHNFSGTVASQPFTVTVLLDENGLPKTIDGTVNVKAAEMDTADARRDKKMRESMKVAEFPFITGKVVALPFNETLRKGAEGESPVVLPFTLKLLDKTHAIEAPVTSWKLEENAAQFEMTFPLSLKKCGIVVPPVARFIKVGDTVTVKATVKLKRS